MLSGVSTSAAPWLTPERTEELLDIIENAWGEGRLLPLFAPSKVGDRQFEEWWARYERGSVTRRWRRKLIELNLQVDLRGVLPAIQAPTLVVHHGQPAGAGGAGEEAADLIPDARFMEFPGTDALRVARTGRRDERRHRGVLTGRRLAGRSDRVLATVLFTDICGSTDKASEVGDQGVARAGPAQRAHPRAARTVARSRDQDAR